MSAGKIFIISAPSGGGKSSILKAILSNNPDFYYSISMTTRKARNGEIDGFNYHFTNKRNFEKMVKRNEFLEYAKVHDNYYGTIKKPIIEHLKNGKVILLDIDVQGKNKITQQMQALDLHDSYVTIFILPPSHAILEQRLRERKSDSEKVIKKRLSNAIKEMEFAGSYEFNIVNEVLEDSILAFKEIIKNAGYKIK